jgi:dolichol-phosphate mannosyltransferase
MSPLPRPRRDVSVIAPAYNEAENLPALVQEIDDALRKTGRSCEIIVVDDASTDNSREILQTLAAQNDTLVPVFLARNSGQSAATVAGFRAAVGDVVFTIDADLQNDPADIPAMLLTLDEMQADAVCGIRARRRDSRVRLLCSRIANAVRRWRLGDSLRDTGCALKCFRRPFVADLPCFNGLHRFLGVFLEKQGARVEQMPVNHRPRTRGVSKYGIGNRLWRGIRDLYGVRWLRDRWVRIDLAEPDAES